MTPQAAYEKSLKSPIVYIDQLHCVASQISIFIYVNLFMASLFLCYIYFDRGSSYSLIKDYRPEMFILLFLFMYIFLNSMNVYIVQMFEIQCFWQNKCKIAHIISKKVWLFFSLFYFSILSIIKQDSCRIYSTWFHLFFILHICTNMNRHSKLLPLIMVCRWYE